MSSLKSINSKMHNNKVVLIENTKIKCTIREFLFPPIYHSFIVLCPSSICQVPTFCSCVRKHWSTVVFLLYIFSIMAMIRKLLAYQKHPWADSLGQLSSSHWDKCALPCSVFYLLFFWITRVGCWDTCSDSTHSQLLRRWLRNPDPAQPTAIQP